MLHRVKREFWLGTDKLNSWIDYFQWKIGGRFCEIFFRCFPGRVHARWGTRNDWRVVHNAPPIYFYSLDRLINFPRIVLSPFTITNNVKLNLIRRRKGCVPVYTKSPTKHNTSTLNGLSLNRWRRGVFCFQVQFEFFSLICKNPLIYRWKSNFIIVDKHESWERLKRLSLSVVCLFHLLPRQLLS